MKPITENTYDFERIRRIGAVYVDKTAYFHALVSDAERNLFFISRPRRFGKSLMISTLKYIFEGRREFFTGLDIDRTDYAWPVHPIIHLVFSSLSTSDMALFRSDFTGRVKIALAEMGYTYDPQISPGENFENAIRQAYTETGKGVVLLIDEYDSPIGHALDRPELAEEIRREMAEFYSRIKDSERMVRFMMMTGVSRFAKLSVFSALSNLTDLTFDPRVAGMLGYTEEELDVHFAEHMSAHAGVMGLSPEAYRAKLRWWFNSYRFSPDCGVKVYNPIAIGITLSRQANEFRPTWSKTGHSSFLMSYFRVNPLEKMDLEEVRGVTEDTFDVADVSRINPVSLLFQTGYLTIKDYQEGDYTLGIPNEEVRRDLNGSILAAITGRDRGEVVGPIASAFRRADADVLRRALEALYADLDYNAFEKAAHSPRRIIVTEASYVRVLQAAFRTSGYDVRAEVSQTNGRCDLVAVGERRIYVAEFKVDASAATAMQQLHDRKYWLPYVDRDLPIYAIGLNFDSKTNLLTDFAFEEIR